MNGLIHSVKRDDRGVALVLLLLIIPLLIIVFTSRLEYSNVVTSIELDLQESLKKSIKAAANQVTERSQAEGNPRIHSDQAHEAFKVILADNLKLNPVSLAPMPHSPLASPPAYSLVVYNGDNAYGATGARAAYQYEYDGSSLSSYPLSDTGFPQRFTVSESGISYGTGGTFDVVFETPGCVVVLSAELKTITGKTVRPVRWASSSLHHF